MKNFYYNFKPSLEKIKSQTNINISKKLTSPRHEFT
jgi:hypothetical protein